MKTIIPFAPGIILAGFLFVSCSKSSSSADTLSTISGTWVVSQWGGYADTVKIVVSVDNADGIMSVVPQAVSQGTNWFVGDTVFSNISPAGGNSYNCIGRYEDNQTAYHTAAKLYLQNNNTVISIVYSTDPVTGITPPQYTWTKQP